MQRGLRIPIAAILVVALAVPVAAHPKDVVKITRVGPIRLNETTIEQVKKWFGKPDFIFTLNIFDCNLKISTWGSDVDAPRFAVVRRKGQKKIRSATVARRKLDAGAKGTLRPHTEKGLRVGHSVDKLKELYPDATSTDVPEGGKQWTLKSSAKGTVQATTKGGKVRSLAGTSSNICPS